VRKATGNHLTHLIPRWCKKKPMNLPSGREPSSSLIYTSAE